MICGIDVLIEFEDAARIGREHVISAALHARPKKKTTCKRCHRVKCRCAKVASRRHRRDYAKNPRKRSV